MFRWPALGPKSTSGRAGMARKISSGGVLGRLGVAALRSLSLLAPSWASSGPIFELSWVDLGPSWASYGLICGPSWVDVCPQDGPGIGFWAVFDNMGTASQWPLCGVGFWADFDNMETASQWPLCGEYKTSGQNLIRPLVLEGIRAQLCFLNLFFYGQRWL